MTDFIDALALRVKQATAQKTPLNIVGGGSKHFYGGPVTGEDVSLAEHSGIVEYEPTELVITAKAGTPLSVIEAALAAEKQMLAFEPPRLSKQSTIGGVVASGLAGPRRGTAGAVKDFVLGATLMDGNARVLHFGGTVMKNVAGYDVSRLLAGSMGTLGILLDLSIKVLPLPVAELTLQFELDQTQAIQTINTWQGSPLPISGSCWYGGVLTVRLSGASAAVSEARQTLGGQALDESTASAFWNSLRDQQHTFFNTQGPLWRLAVKPVHAPLNLAGDTLVEWAGGQRWLKPAEGVTAEQIRAVAKAAGGHATLYFTPDARNRQHAFTALDPALALIQQRLKQEFDPAGIFNQNRLAPIL